MNAKAKLSAATAALVFAPFVTNPVFAAPHFEVKITNITKAQTFTPILLFSHKKGVKLFTLGDPASVELEHLCEAGDTAPLTALLEANPNVKAVTTAAAPLPAGQSLTMSVDAGDGFAYVSVAAMLIPTNDGCFAILEATGTDRNEVLTLTAPAYDAGTEFNDESCTHIPGPDNVCQGEGFNPSRDGAEGFVHVHEAIHGIGDLPASSWDWRNPVAQVRIKLVP
jgi:hypothetical protein